MSDPGGSGPADDRSRDGDGPDGGAPAGGTDRRLAGPVGGAPVLPLSVLALVPWTVVVYPDGVDLVFAWGLVNTNPVGVVDLWSYLFVYTRGLRSLPARLAAWPGSTALFVLALASSSLGVVGREDRRVTAALLALAGLVHLRVALGLVRVGGTAVPVGTALLFGAAWWTFGRRSRSTG